MADRTDPHRPGAIIPAEYEYKASYVFGAHMMPPIGLDLVAKVREQYPVFQHPSWGFGLGKCSVCGAHFNYGDVWLHVPTNELITLGHDCADKYEFCVDRSAYWLEVGNAKEARAKAILAAKVEEAFQAFCAPHDGLAEAFKVEHKIIADIESKLRRYGSISDKQIAFVMKLAHEVKNPKPEEAHVPAPEGKVTFTGTVLSNKIRETMYGLQKKLTVKVETPEGSWLAWGTCPKAIEDVERDSVVTLTATLTQGKDAHFAIMKRPTGKVVKAAQAA